MDSLSFSNTISKQTVLENTSMTYASLEDAKKRENDAISNERIQNGDSILDIYEVTSDAISGGMGSVWRVHHQSWNTDLAMKRPQPRFFAEGSESRKEQFIKECENWINLGLHPNIVSCYYVREIGGVPTIFSEWMDNGSLKDRIADGSLYEGMEEEVQERILDIAIQAARGLQYSHENGLIHQDVKLGNLLLSKNWDAKVADFGLAKAKEQLDDKSDAAKTTGYTLAYCPAEQANGDKPEKWMDVYAWALTVLEMYAGKRLWDTGAEAKEHFDEYLSNCKYPIPKKMQSLLKSCLTEKSDSFSDFASVLLNIYYDCTEKQYARSEPDPAANTADRMNNEALSYLDLGLEDEAEHMWEEALTIDSRNLNAAVNLIFYQWRKGEKTDIDVKRRLEDLRDDKDFTDVWKQYIHERGGDEFALEFPRPIRGKSGVYVRNAYIKDNSIMFVTNVMVIHQYFCVISYDIDTGEQLAAYPKSPVNKDLPLGRADRSFRFSKEDLRLVIFGNRFNGPSQLWDLKKQVLLEESDEITESPLYQNFDKKEAEFLSCNGLRTVYVDKKIVVCCPETGRRIKSITVPSPTDFSEYFYTTPFAAYDEQNNRIIFYRQGQPNITWFVIPNPAETMDGYQMPYRVSFPRNYDKMASEKAELKACMDDFAEAEKQQNRRKMQEAYVKASNLTAVSDYDYLQKMNKELMRTCEYEKPYSVKKLYVPKAEMSSETYKDGYAYYSDEKTHLLSVDSEEKLQNRKRILQEDFLPINRGIQKDYYEIKDSQKYWINAIKAVSSDGKCLILELGETGAHFFESGEYDGPIHVVWMDKESGSFREIDSRSNPRKKVNWVIQSDKKAAFSWDYGTSLTRYDYAMAYTEKIWLKLFEKDQYNDHDKIDSITMSADGRKMLIKSENSDHDWHLTVYDTNRKTEDCVYSVDRYHYFAQTMISGDGRFYMMRFPGKREPVREPGTWKLKLTSNNQCIWQTSDESFAGVDEIDGKYRISADNCFITDEKGKRLYALYWRYKPVHDDECQENNSSSQKIKKIKNKKRGFFAKLFGK